MGLETATLLTIGAITSTAGAVYSGVSGYEAGRAAKVAAERQAKAEQEAAEAEAAKIKDRAERLKASQEASLASSGVKLSTDGTAGALLNETDRLAEQDALAVLQSGQNRANTLRAQGDQAYRTGVNNAFATGLNAVSTAANAAVKIDAAKAPGRKADALTPKTPLITPPRKSILGDT